MRNWRVGWSMKKKMKVERISTRRQEGALRCVFIATDWHFYFSFEWYIRGDIVLTSGIWNCIRNIHGLCSALSHPHLLIPLPQTFTSTHPCCRPPDCLSYPPDMEKFYSSFMFTRNYINFSTVYFGYNFHTCWIHSKN